MSISMYDTRVMVRALEQNYEPTTFLTRHIFGNTETHGSRNIDIDIVKGGREVAVYVRPQHEGKTVENKGYSTKTYKAPYVKEKMTTQADKFLQRPAGQTVYMKDTAAKRARKEIGKNLKELGERLDRLEELQAAQAVQEGKITVKGTGYDEEIDFAFAETHLPALANDAKWDEHDTADPIKNFSDWVQLIADDSGLYPKEAILGVGAGQNLLRCKSVKELLDNRRIVMGEIKPQKYNREGVRYLGYLNEPGIDLWVYAGTYNHPDTGALTKYVKDQSVIMVGDGARATRHYGAIEDVENEIEIARFPKSWISKDPSARWVMLQSAPLLVPHQVDSFLCATVY